jgi:hypothetical protein
VVGGAAVAVTEDVLIAVVEGVAVLSARAWTECEGEVHMEIRYGTAAALDTRSSASYRWPISAGRWGRNATGKGA